MLKLGLVTLGLAAVLAGSVHAPAAIAPPATTTTTAAPTVAVGSGPVTLTGSASCGAPGVWRIAWSAHGPPGATVTYSNADAVLPSLAWSGWQSNTATASYSNKMSATTMTVMMQWDAGGTWPHGAASAPVTVASPSCPP